ncbi:MAG: glucose-6-phosphate dehydrogenase [Candidatus Lambdaproteobacteria bacterium]|nr:glucose-6-phosphate dehydrogenase [Candidatus Lambdaproteobacteria bacterium]
MNPLRDGLVSERTPEPQVLVIFGASGDLTQRKLLPALYTLARERLLPAAFAVVGFARRDAGGDDVFREEMRAACDRFARRKPVDATLWESFSRGIFYHVGDFNDADAYRRLKARLEEIDKHFGIPANRLFYLSTPPSVFPVIVGNLGAAGLVSRAYQPWTRIIVEKPFGRDLESAQVLNRQLKQVFRETQIFRIDHYLGKETVQNMLTFRFGNGIFEPLWNERHVEQVQITAAESIGVEGRGGYFEEAGIMRDMVQNHLFQVMCLTTMEPPVNLESGAVRDEKVKLLKSLRPIHEEQIDRYVVRSQYAAGQVLGESVPGYLQEPGVAHDSTTETFVALKLHVDNWRWGRVPIYLRAAKRMPKKITDITVKFRDAPHQLFQSGNGAGAVPNLLTIRIQPDEGIAIHFGSKVPGPAMTLAPVNMEFRYGAAFGQDPPEAYERLILDAMLGDSTLFIRDDETEASWAFISRIHDAWAAQRKRALPYYPAGTWGPEEADGLMGPEEATWRKP